MRIDVPRRLSRPATAVAAGLLLAGCMKVSPDAGFGPVAFIAERDLGKAAVRISGPADEAYVAGKVKDLLRKGLTPDRAVQIAILNNRGLQAAFNDVGISEAQFVQSALLPNPTVSLAGIKGPGSFEIERQILVNVLALVTQGRRERIARARIEEAQMRVAEKVLKLAADTRRAWYQAVASHHRVSFLQSAAVNARTVSELFRKLGETGAANKLDQAREHVFYAELKAQLGKARLDHVVDREKLVRFLGLWGRQAGLALPSRLPSLPRRPRTRPLVERDAIRRNIGIAIARAGLEATIRTYGLVNATRYLNLLEVRGLSSLERAKSVDPATGDVDKERSRKTGIELEFQIPVFDFGETRQREVRESYMREVNRLLETSVNVRSVARESYQRYRGAYTLARHYDRYVLPLRKIISDESLLRYNAMIVDVIPLLAEARQRINSNIMAINARRDFWLAEASLRAAIIGGGAEAGPAGGDGPAVAVTAGAGH